jgi:hypothetical protein
MNKKQYKLEHKKFSNKTYGLFENQIKIIEPANDNDELTKIIR